MYIVNFKYECVKICLYVIYSIIYYKSLINLLKIGAYNANVLMF